jgi:putative hydrolase of HD superfamily
MEFEVGITGEAKSAKSKWTDLNHCYKTHKTMVENGQSLVCPIKKFTIKNGSTTIWNYAENLINKSMNKGI